MSSSQHVRPSICVLLVLCAAGGFINPVEAITWTVSNLGSCSNTGPGTSGLPFCSLQVGVDHAQPGDIVETLGGSYGPAQLNVTPSGTVAARITVRSVPSRAAVIIGPLGAGDVDGTGVMITGSYLNFEGFEVRDAAGTGIRNLGSFVTIRDNFVHDNARRCDPLVVPKCGQGIAANGSTPRYGTVIERNLSAFNGTSASQDHGYYISSPGAIVRNNIATGASAFGFQIYPNCDDCLIYNNVAHGNTRNSGFLIGGDGVANFSTGVQAFNNIATGNAGYGFWLYNNGTALVVMRNNIVWGNRRRDDPGVGVQPARQCRHAAGRSAPERPGRPRLPHQGGQPGHRRGKPFIRSPG